MLGACPPPWWRGVGKILEPPPGPWKSEGNAQQLCLVRARNRGGEVPRAAGLGSREKEIGSGWTCRGCRAAGLYAFPRIGGRKRTKDRGLRIGGTGSPDRASVAAPFDRRFR